MKKILSLLTFTFLSSAISYAQDFPDFGKPAKEEIELKECVFEKDAASVVLIHEAFSYSEDYLQLITTHHIRIKILKPSGVTAANITIPYYRSNNFERIIDLEAMTMNISDDGKISKQKVERKLIYTTKINEEKGEINFVFPSVKTGSIIEYQYRSIMRNYWGLRDWYFQKDIPVLISRYHLKIIPDKQFAYKIIKRPDAEATVLPEPGRIFFEMKNIPALSDEPYMDSKNDYTQKVNFQISGVNSRWGSNKMTPVLSSWHEVNYTLHYLESFGKQLESKIPDADDFIRQTKLLQSPEEKMNIIYNYVRDNMVWNNYKSVVALSDLNDAWKEHTGSSGDINLTLVSLLKKAELEVYPVLVSERFHGNVDTTYPFVDQFNSVFACVVIGNKKYFLDATDKYTPAYITPKNVLNTKAFIINLKSGQLLNIQNDSLQYKEGIYVDMKISEEGNVNGQALIRSKDYARIKKKEEYQKDKEKLKEFYSKREGIPLILDKYEIINLEKDSLPLDQKIEFKSNLTGSGDYKFIPLNLFCEFDKNPFLSDNRFSNINFGYRRTINLNSVIEIPSNYSVDEMPESVTIETPSKDIVFSRQITFNKNNNTIYCNLKFEFTKSYYESGFYPTLKEAYKKLFNFLKEQIVLKKK
ncbi:DUF3857 domain-containing protein [Ferruginibacter sp.]